MAFFFLQDSRKTQSKLRQHPLGIFNINSDSTPLKMATWHPFSLSILSGFASTRALHLLGLCIHSSFASTRALHPLWLRLHSGFTSTRVSYPLGLCIHSGFTSTQALHPIPIATARAISHLLRLLIKTTDYLSYIIYVLGND